MRARLSDGENVWLQIRIPAEMRDEFQAATEDSGGMSEQARKLITQYLRKRAAIQRLKKTNLVKGKKC